MIRPKGNLNTRHRLLLCLISEGFARTLAKEGFVSALWRGTTTALLGVVIVLFTRIPGSQDLLLRYPELAGATLVVQELVVEEAG